MTTEIELTDMEKKVVEQIAEERYQINRDKNIRDRKIGDQSNTKVDEQGMAGEIVVAKRLNIYPDLKIEVTQGGIDLTLPDGTTVDVKTTEYSDGHLLAPTYKKDREHADVFLLVTGEFNDGEPFKIRGWAEAEKLFQEDNLKWIGSQTKSYALEQKQLHDLDEIPT